MGTLASPLPTSHPPTHPPSQSNSQPQPQATPHPPLPILPRLLLTNSKRINPNGPFAQVTQNLLSIGSFPIEKLAHAHNATKARGGVTADLEGLDLPFAYFSNPGSGDQSLDAAQYHTDPYSQSQPQSPTNSRFPSDLRLLYGPGSDPSSSSGTNAATSSSNSNSSNPLIPSMHFVAQLHQTCSGAFGNIDSLKWEFLEDENPDQKQCILTITRPNGQRRSYRSEPNFTRKTDAKARAAAVAVQMGAIEFIVSGSGGGGGGSTNSGNGGYSGMGRLGGNGRMGGSNRMGGGHGYGHGHGRMGGGKMGGAGYNNNNNNNNNRLGGNKMGSNGSGGSNKSGGGGGKAKYQARNIVLAPLNPLGLEDGGIDGVNGVGGFGEANISLGSGRSRSPGLDSNTGGPSDISYQSQQQVVKGRIKEEGFPGDTDDLSSINPANASASAPTNNTDTNISTTNGDADADDEPDAASDEIMQCCKEWRAGLVQPRWIMYQERRGDSSHGCALLLTLSPNSQKFYSVSPTYPTQLKAKSECSQVAIKEGILEFIKFGNGQKVPAPLLGPGPGLDSELGVDSFGSNTTNALDAQHTLPISLQSFFDSLPKPFPENVGDNTALSLNAPTLLNSHIQLAKGARLSCQFYFVQENHLHGCILRLTTPTSLPSSTTPTPSSSPPSPPSTTNTPNTRTYLVPPLFLKRSDAKAAVCLLSLSLSVKSYISSLITTVSLRITPEMRKKANEVILPMLGSEYAKVRGGMQPLFGYLFELGAFGCTVTLDLPSSPSSPTSPTSSSNTPTSPSKSQTKSRTWAVPPDYRSKADAKVAVAYKYGGEMIEFVRFQGGEVPPGHDPFKPYRNGQTQGLDRRDGRDGRQKSGERERESETSTSNVGRGKSVVPPAINPRFNLGMGITYPSLNDPNPESVPDYRYRNNRQDRSDRMDRNNNYNHNNNHNKGNNNNSFRNQNQNRQRWGSQSHQIYQQPGPNSNTGAGSNTDNGNNRLSVEVDLSPVDDGNASMCSPPVTPRTSQTGYGYGYGQNQRRTPTKPRGHRSNNTSNNNNNNMGNSTGSGNNFRIKEEGEYSGSGIGPGNGFGTEQEVSQQTQRTQHQQQYQQPQQSQLSPPPAPHQYQQQQQLYDYYSHYPTPSPTVYHHSPTGYPSPSTYSSPTAYPHPHSYPGYPPPQHLPLHQFQHQQQQGPSPYPYPPYPYPPPNMPNIPYPPTNMPIYPYPPPPPLPQPSHSSTAPPPGEQPPPGAPTPTQTSPQDAGAVGGIGGIGGSTIPMPYYTPYGPAGGGYYHDPSSYYAHAQYGAGSVYPTHPPPPPGTGYPPVGYGVVPPAATTSSTTTTVTSTDTSASTGVPTAPVTSAVGISKATSPSVSDSCMSTSTGTGPRSGSVGVGASRSNDTEVAKPVSVPVSVPVQPTHTASDGHSSLTSHNVTGTSAESDDNNNNDNNSSNGSGGGNNNSKNSTSKRRRSPSRSRSRSPSKLGLRFGSRECTPANNDNHHSHSHRRGHEYEYERRYTDDEYEDGECEDSGRRRHKKQRSESSLPVHAHVRSSAEPTMMVLSTPSPPPPPLSLSQGPSLPPAQPLSPSLASQVARTSHPPTESPVHSPMSLSTPTPLPAQLPSLPPSLVEPTSTPTTTIISLPNASVNVTVKRELEGEGWDSITSSKGATPVPLVVRHEIQDRQDRQDRQERQTSVSSAIVTRERESSVLSVYREREREGSAPAIKQDRQVSLTPSAPSVSSAISMAQIVKPPVIKRKRGTQGTDQAQTRTQVQRLESPAPVVTPATAIPSPVYTSGVSASTVMAVTPVSSHAVLASAPVQTAFAPPVTAPVAPLVGTSVGTETQPSFVQQLIDYCKSHKLDLPEFGGKIKHEEVDDGDDGDDGDVGNNCDNNANEKKQKQKDKYAVWIVLGNERMELPNLFDSENEGRERVARQVLKRLRSQWSTA